MQNPWERGHLVRKSLKMRAECPRSRQGRRFCKNLKGGRKIEFIAQGQSPAGIEFYSWDFAFDKDKGFKSTVIIDKEGKQTLALKAGMHAIAVKVVDNDGLENTEVVQLKINGIVEKVPG